MILSRSFTRQQRGASAIGVVDDLDDPGLGEVPFHQAIHRLQSNSSAAMHSGEQRQGILLPSRFDHHQCPEQP
jgi:hypothetical protein